jgi:hypothetical protein
MSGARHRRKGSRLDLVSRRVTCPCGRVVEHRAGRRPRFCSSRCRNRENGRGRVRKALLGRDTGAPAKLQKKHSKLKALQRAKTLSSHRILAPAHVLACEVFGGHGWRHATSTGGVAVEVGHLRSRALVERSGGAS